MPFCVSEQAFAGQRQARRQGWQAPGTVRVAGIDKFAESPPGWPDGHRRRLGVQPCEQLRCMGQEIVVRDRSRRQNGDLGESFFDESINQLVTLVDLPPALAQSTEFAILPDLLCLYRR